MKLKNREIVAIYNFIEAMKNVHSVDKGKGYIYKSAKNNKALQGEIDALKEVEPKTRSEYAMKQTEIQRKYVRMEDGQPVLKDGTVAKEGQNVMLNQVQFDNVEEMNKELTKLANEIDWDEVNKEDVEYNELLDKEVEIELVKYDVDDMWDGIDESGFGLMCDLGIWDLG